MFVNETHFSYANIRPIHMIPNGSSYKGNEEMLELVRDVETKLNLPEIKSKTTDFSYIS